MRLSPFRTGEKERRLIRMQGEAVPENLSPPEGAEHATLSPEEQGAQSRADAARYYMERFVQTPLQTLGKKADLNDVQGVQGIVDALVPPGGGAKLLGEEEVPVAQEVKQQVEDQLKSLGVVTDEKEEAPPKEEKQPKEEPLPLKESPSPNQHSSSATLEEKDREDAKPKTEEETEQKPVEPEQPPASVEERGSMSEQALLDAIHAITGSIYPLVKQNEEAQEQRVRLQAQVDAGKGDDQTVQQIASLDQEITKRNLELVGHRDRRKQFEDALRQKLERGEA